MSQRQNMEEGFEPMSKKDPEPEQPYKILKDKLIKKPEAKKPPS